MNDAFDVRSINKMIISNGLNVPSKKKPNIGNAWLFLTIAFIIHVADEATHDFLALYNPIVVDIKEKISFLPIPTFSFEIWLILLSVAILILFSFLPFAFRNAGWMLILAYIYGIVMLLNGINHIVFSLVRGEMIAGAYSSPLLLLTSVYLLWMIRKVKNHPGP